MTMKKGGSSVGLESISEASFQAEIIRQNLPEEKTCQGVLEVGENVGMLKKEIQ